MKKPKEALATTQGLQDGASRAVGVQRGVSLEPGHDASRCSWGLSAV